MRILKEIENRFGITLPKMYRRLAEKKRLEYGCDCFELADGNWLSPAELLEFEWDDFRNPIAGLVPFAKNGAGDYFCWYLPKPGLDGEPVVMECAHDCYEGRWFAPSLSGAVFRQSLEWFSEGLAEEAGEEVGDVLKVLRYYAPKKWWDVLRKLKNLSNQPEAFDEFCEDIQPVIQTCFGKKFIDKGFIWDEAGIPLTASKKVRGSKVLKTEAILKPDAALEKIIKEGSQLIRKIKKNKLLVDDSRIDREKVPSQVELDELEKRLGRPVPVPLKNIMAGGELWISWSLDELKDGLPKDYRKFSGAWFFCDPQRLRQVEGAKQKFLKKARVSAKNKEVWADSFAFDYAYSINVNSFISIEQTDTGAPGRVLCLEGKGEKSVQGYHVLSPDFETFLKEWSALGFLTTDLEVLRILTNEFSKPLSSKTPFAKKWLKWLTS